MTIYLIGIAAAAATFVGGYFALRFKDQLHLILGFSAGAVIGLALFDILPEAIDIGAPFHTPSAITTAVALGFVLYLLLDRFFTIGLPEGNVFRAHLGPASLTVHSLLDGLAIGLAFQVSAAVGAVVTVAVLVHDFSDGVNTVNLSLAGSGKAHIARGWLVADALAPLLGIAATHFIRIPEAYLSLIFALFAGFFLYIGASELLPESQHRHPRILTTVLTILGMLVIYTAVHLATP